MKNGLSGFLVALLLISPAPLLANGSETEPASFPAISEIAWMGTLLSANDEWIELQNPGDHPIDLTGWILEDTKGSVSIVLKGTLEPQGFFLLERTDDTSVPEIIADQIYTGALSNAEVGLRLKSPEGLTVEEVLSWTAGDNTTKATMQKYESTWCTGVATPKTSNQCLIPEPTQEPEPIIPEENNTYHASHEIWINEIMVGSEKQPERDDWIEFFNPRESEINLSGWTLEIEGKNPYVFEADKNPTLPPKGFFILSHYTNSDNSVLKNKPQINDTGFDLPSFPLKINLKNATGALVETVFLESPAETFRSWEKINNEWKPATKRINLKANSIASWATPGSANNSEIQIETTPSTETQKKEASIQEIKISSTFIEKIPEEYVSFSKGVITFISVKPNPLGKDEDNESFTLQNHSNTSIDLTKWVIRNQKNQDIPLKGLILNPLEKRTILASTFKLTLKNEKGALSLLDPLLNTIDSIAWEKAAEGEILWSLESKPTFGEARVIKVIDGDTFEGTQGSEKIIVRLLGIDTPESVHPFKPIEYYGERASKILKEMVEGKTVTLQYEDRITDKYGRHLAYVILDGININELMVREGHAYAYKRFPFREKENYLKLEEEAKQKEKGLWSNGLLRKIIEERQGIKTEELPITETVLSLAEPEIQNPCPGNQLTLQAIFPKPGPKDPEEFIQIINPGKEAVCLKQWTLDDTLEKGSQPFTLPDEILAPQNSRTFYKSETKISLNNSNDCAILINPNGIKADEICYEKIKGFPTLTHESITEETKESTASKTKKENKKGPKISAPTPRITPWELTEGVVEGVIENINPQTGEITLLPRMVLSLNPEALSKESIATLLHQGDSVAVEYRNREDGLEAVAINQALKTENLKTKTEAPFSLPWHWLLTTGLVIIAWIPKQKWIK